MHYVGNGVTAEAGMHEDAGEVLAHIWEDRETERAPGAIPASSFFLLYLGTK